MNKILVKVLHNVLSNSKIKGPKAFKNNSKKLVLEKLHIMFPSIEIKEKTALTGSIYFTLNIPANTFNFLNPSDYYEDTTYSGKKMTNPITLNDYYLPYKIRISDHKQKPGGGMQYTGEEFDRLGESHIDIYYTEYIESNIHLTKYIDTKLEKITKDLNNKSFVEMEIM